MNRLFLACDEGTSSARAVLFNEQGTETATAQYPLLSHFPVEGWVEQDAEEIWNQQLTAVKDLFERGELSIDSVDAIGITNQRETTILWERESGKPVAPAITWQCRRTLPLCEDLKVDSTKSQRIVNLTGLQVHPYFSATKLRWLLDHIPDAQSRAEQGDLLFGTVDSWLIYQLTAGRCHVIDRTNASRTMLMNIESGDWDEEMLGYFNIPQAVLPSVCESIGEIGIASGDVIGSEIPISGVAGDQQAALVGQNCTQSNTAKLTYGTGAFLLMHTGNEAIPSQSGLLTTAAASLTDEPEFALEGSVFSAGSAVQWLRDELKIIQKASETESIANSVKDSRGVHLVPAFEGLGAPYWDASARGALTGLTRGSTREHIVRATLESIAFQVYDLISAFRSDTNVELADLNVDGGAATNNFLLQFQADLLDIPIVRPKYLESTARGAAYLAAKGIRSSVEWEYEIDRVFEPNMTKTDRETALDAWHTAVKQVTG